MKYCIACLLCFMLLGTHAFARKHRYRGEPRDEVGLMNNVLGCLKYKDSVSYYYLFPPFDTLWRMVMHNADHSPETVQALNELKEHPQRLIEFDPYFNHRIMAQFFNVLKKGEDSGIHWEAVVMQRYELVKQGPSRALLGYEKIAPERFQGYMFVRDLLGRLTFCISITEIQKISGYFYGGQVLNILEASSIDEFMKREDQERRYLDWLATHPVADSGLTDTVKKDSLDASLSADGDTSAATRKKRLLSVNAPASDDEGQDVRREVIERKYYEGKFDDEIPVKLYVRYMKDRRKGSSGIAYDGLYKFGDQEDYVRLTITKGPDGKWIMDDDQPIGSMELELKNKIYTGTWTNNESQSGYDVVLKPAAIAEQKMEQLEKILEKGLTGEVNEDTRPERRNKRTADTAAASAVALNQDEINDRKAARSRRKAARIKARQAREAEEKKEEEAIVAKQKRDAIRAKARKLDLDMQHQEEAAERKKEKDEDRREAEKEKQKEKSEDEKAGDKKEGEN